ncbi:Omp28-related outer membrane protein, partial [bacterium]|nr:Omp28-related outer membrane protein [bacterium]
MQRTLLAVLVVLLVAAGTVFAFPRTVLFEEFTNTYCGPCASAAPTVYGFIEDNFDDLAILIWHGWWPGSGDPWYQNNISQNTTRINYYGVSGVPDAVIDGVEEPSPFQGTALQDAFDDRMDIESPVEILISSGGGPGAGVTATITVNSADEAVTGNYVMRVATVEGVITYNAPNGQNEWGYAVLDVMPDMNGDTFTIDANSTETFTYEFDWDASFYDEENMYITAWIQNPSTSEVLQSAMAEFSQAYGFSASQSADAAFVNPLEDGEFTMNIFNQGQNEDTYDVEITSDVADGWDFTYTTPEGTQSGNSTMTLASGEQFTSDITFETNDEPGASGFVTMTITSQGEPQLSQTFDFYVMSSSEILLLNSQPDGDYGEFFSDAIEAHPDLNPNSYAHWVEANALFPGDDLANSDVQCVIWFHEQSVTANLNPTMITALENFMLAGGSVLISGKTMPGLLAGAGLNDWLGYSDPTQYNVTQEMTLNGVEGDPMFSGLEFSLGGGDGAGNHARPTTMRAEGDGEEVLL